MNYEVASSIKGLEHLPEPEQHSLLRHAVVRAIPEQHKTYLPHRAAPKVMLVVSGQAETLFQDAEGHLISLGPLTQGMVVGHDALDNVHPFPTVLTPVSDMIVLQWSLDWLLDHAHLLPAFLQWLRQEHMQQRVLIALSRVPLFNSLTLADRMMIIEHLQTRSFERDAIVFEQASPASSLFLIDAGQFIVERDQKIVATLNAGDFFGEMALVSDAQAPHNATVRAYTPAQCLELPGDVFSSLLETYPTLQAALRSEIDRRLRHLARLSKDPRQQEYLAVAAQRGVFRGSHILVRLPALCPPGCQLCEDACAERFGQSRLQLNGANIDMWDITTSCRQCRIGAECVEACPEDAIVFDTNGAFRITAACTGCGDCVPACPYNAVQLQPIDLEDKSGPLWTLWKRLHGQKQTPRYVAAKCDFCAGHEDFACITDCPTGSLRLLAVEELFSF